MHEKSDELVWPKVTAKTMQSVNNHQLMLFEIILGIAFTILRTSGMRLIRLVLLRIQGKEKFDSF